MEIDMDISLFCRVSTMAALSTSKLLPLESAVNVNVIANGAPAIDPINVPQIVRLRSEHDCDQAFHLLLSILRQPELGLYIRHLDILRDTSFHGQYEPTRIQRTISEHDGMRLRLAVRNAGWYGAEEEMVLNMLLQRRFDPDFTHGLQSSRYRGGRHTRGSHIIQALAALLISVAPNLESMKLRPIGRFMKGGFSHLPLEQFFLRANKTFSANYSHLPNLRRVDLLHTDNLMAHDPILFSHYDLLYHMSLFQQLPAIETIRVGGMDIDEEGQEDLVPLSSNVRRIELLHSVLPTMFLCSIIASSKRLQHFVHSVGGRAIMETGHWHMGFPAILRALLIHRKSLESLDLDTDSDYSSELEEGELDEYQSAPANDDEDDDMDPVYDDEDEDSEAEGDDAVHRAFINQKSVIKLTFLQTGALRSFTALRRLCIGVRCLFEMARGISMQHDSNTTLADLLPPRLEYLCIRGYIPGENSFYDMHIQDLFSKFVAGQLRSLTELIGVREYIPNSQTLHIDDVDTHPELIWIDERDAMI